MYRISGIAFPVSNLIEDSPASINVEKVIPQKFMPQVTKMIGTLK